MTFNTHNLVAWHGRTAAEHVALRDGYAADGFRPLSTSIYGSTGDPRYAAVMVKRPVVIATKSFVNLDAAAMQQTFDDMAKQGYGPFIITATGSKNEPLYAMSFRKMAHIPLTRGNLSKDAFAQLNREQHDAGKILLWADCFGSEGDPRYCAIWGPNPDRVAWNADTLDDGGAVLQQRFDAMCSVGARPALISVTPAGRIMEMYVDSQVGPWASRVGMSPAEYQAEVDKQIKGGLWPVCVSAWGSGSGARFAAIFARQEETLPRTFRAVSPAGTPAVAAIDAGMRKYLEDENLRGAAIAIVKGTRLVYARGYTNAEAAPVYSDVTPQTLFRQASVSKSFCAVAIWKLIEQGKLSLDTTLQSVLALKQPDGSAPKDSRFKDVKIRHLLESRSGIDQGGVWGAVDASKAANGTLPSDGMEVARWITTLDMTGDPGDNDNVVYGNTDYFLLSLVVKAKTSATSFEAGLKSLVLNPLGQTHTRGSRALAGLQAADEARYHMTVHNPDNNWALFQLETGASDMTPERPLVPTHYGTFDLDMFDGCGGLSSSVVDVARLCAMFADRTDNPVLKPETIDSMLAKAVTATMNGVAPGDGSAHGYHGFDGVKNVDVANHRVQITKGGWLPGQGTYYVGTTGGMFYVIAQNGNKRADGTVNWLDEIKPIADAHDWGTGDLFPTFGMPSLNPVANAAPEPPQFFRLPAETMAQVEGSMARTRALASRRILQRA